MPKADNVVTWRSGHDDEPWEDPLVLNNDWRAVLADMRANAINW
jgi:hypothetical protein